VACGGCSQSRQGEGVRPYVVLLTPYELTRQFLARHDLVKVV
jgi:hypothetical protein